MPEFVNEVVAAQTTIKRRPVYQRYNPTFGDAWGSSVHYEHQGKAYRASAYEMRQRRRALLAEDAAANNPAQGGYKPYEHPEEEFGVRTASSSSGWRSASLKPGPQGTEHNQPSQDEPRQPQTSEGNLPMLIETEPYGGSKPSLPDWNVETPMGQPVGEVHSFPPDFAQ